ncbi:MAG: N-methylhydantoinase A [Rhodobacteraceae bacterium HLUCCA12]|nr:MAG: N-methylhydantoinase A [Rhodobacteraceae bacterium HLUCCA12]
MKQKSPPDHADLRVGVEIGGTFTDLVWHDAKGTLRTGKTPSTPEAIEAAVLSVLADEGVPLAQVAGVRHGSTIATNALIMRKGAATGLLTTRGFRDVAILGRADRDHGIYDMQYRRPPPAIRRQLIREVPERIGPDGAVIEPLDLDAAWHAVEALLAQGVEAIAICLIHAYRNPVHEQALARMIRARAPHVSLTLSHEVSPEFREYERTVTTVVNAFVGPVVDRYVGRLAEGLRERGFGGVLSIMQSNGGVMPADAAGDNAVRMLMSGPAAGVRAAMWFAARNGIDDVITLDMGGTSTDVAIAPGRVPATVPELAMDGLPIRTASIDMATIGAGGGSIAQIDPGGFLGVGPESAGARPGPACYGRGGDRPTVTDAQVVAGLLRPTQFFSGRMALSHDAASATLATLDPDGDPHRAADSVLRLINSNMAAAVRLVSTGRGIDPRDYTLVAYGGGGPIHAAMVADELDIGAVLVPWSPGLVSAFGLLIADTLIDLAQSDPHPLDAHSLDGERCDAFAATARELATRNGVAPEDCESRIGLDMRYAGQAFELTIWTDGQPLSDAALRRLFEDEHRTRYGYARAGLGVEVVSYRLRLVAPTAAQLTTPLPDGSAATAETVTLSIAGQKLEARAIDRAGLAPGARLKGPAVLTEPTSTTVIPPQWQAECLPSGDLMLKRIA